MCARACVNVRTYACVTDLTVGAVATAAHGPGDEGSSRHGPQANDRGESRAASERTGTNSCYVGKCDGRECCAAPKGFKAYASKSVGEPD